MVHLCSDNVSKRPLIKALMFKGVSDLYSLDRYLLMIELLENTNVHKKSNFSPSPNRPLQRKGSLNKFLVRLITSTEIGAR